MSQKEFEFDYSSITLGSGISPSVDTITLTDTITLSNTYNYPNYPSMGDVTLAPTGNLTGGYIYTTNGTNTGWDSINYPNSNGSLQVNGDANFEGDIKIKGKSLVESLEKIEEKLAILRPNEELESKWEELRELRNKYMALEKEIIEKEKVWAILKK